MFDEVWRLFRNDYYDRGMSGVDWEQARARHRPAAERARTQEEVHEAILALLGELHSSHAALVEQDVYEQHVEPDGKAQLAPQPQYGLTFTRLNEGLFVSDVLPGSVAAAAGVLRGDRLVSVDGVRAERAPLRPALWDPGLGGPRSYRLPVREEAQRVELELERRRDGLGIYEVTLRARPWSQLEAISASRQVFERSGFKIGYIHLYHLLSMEVPKVLACFLAYDLRDADAVLVDLRGRGGLPDAVDSVLEIFDPNIQGGPLWSKRVVALVDANTRSAKELLAFEWRQRRIGPLVGTRTAGAVVGAQFQRLSDGAWLLIPQLDMRSGTGGVVLEGKGVTPDVEVQDQLPWSAGEDAIISAGLDTVVEQLLRDRRSGRRHGWY